YVAIPVAPAERAGGATPCRPGDHAVAIGVELRESHLAVRRGAGAGAAVADPAGSRHTPVAEVLVVLAGIEDRVHHRAEPLVHRRLRVRPEAGRIRLAAENVAVQGG